MKTLDYKEINQETLISTRRECENQQNSFACVSSGFHFNDGSGVQQAPTCSV